MYKIACYLLLFLVSHPAFSEESQISLTRNMHEFIQTFEGVNKSHSFAIKSSIEKGQEIRKGTGGLSFLSKTKPYNMEIVPGYKLNGEYKILLSPIEGNNLKAKLEFMIKVDGEYKSVPIKLNNKFSLVANFVKGGWLEYLAGKEVILENVNKADLEPFQDLHRVLIKALLEKAKSKLDDYYDYEEIKEITSTVSFLKILARWKIKDNKIEFTNPLSSLFGRISVIEREIFGSGF